MKITFWFFFAILSSAQGYGTCRNAFISCLEGLDDYKYKDMCVAVVEMRNCADKCAPYIAQTSSFLLEGLDHIYSLFGHRIDCPYIKWRNIPELGHFASCENKHIYRVQKNVDRCLAYLDSSMVDVAKGVICSNVDVLVHRCMLKFSQLFPKDFSPRRVRRAAGILKLKLVNMIIEKYIPDYRQIPACRKFNITIESLDGAAGNRSSKILLLVGMAFILAVLKLGFEA